MTVIELKEKLIAKIKETNDEQLLEHISDIIEYEHNGEIHVMSEGEIEAVREGLEQIKNGQCISNEEANRQVEEWLKK
jgi:predicted transcriptional regulator